MSDAGYTCFNNPAQPESRKFSELLKEIWQGSQPLKNQLTDKFCEYNPSTDREKISRKISNWLADRNLPANREEFFKICFALHANEADANRLLGITAESSIHYRNPRELVYLFALRSGMDYPEARALLTRVWDQKLPATTAEYREYILKYGRSEKTGYLTSFFQNSFRNVATEQELALFLQKNRGRFGCCHNTAYRKFKQMIDCLISPASEDNSFLDKKKYTLRQVVEEYLRMDVPYARDTKEYTRLQKTIKKSWPSSRTIYEMYSRKRDVDRKTLLLLYLATDGETMCSPENYAREHCRRIDLMLSECGFPLLNPHNPFDSLVISAIRSEDEEDSISDRMVQMIRQLYEPENKETWGRLVYRQENCNG